MTTPTPPEAPPEVSPNQEALNAAATRLQGELEAVENGELRAMYLHELGLVLERLGDQPSAARCYKESYNSAPGYREPLEALVTVLRRRGSPKNLGRLLEELSKLSNAGEGAEADAWARQETARAKIELGVYQLDHLNDAGAAQQSLRDAVADNADDLAAWLELELLGAKNGDLEQRQEALRERASRAESPVWRALLLLDQAELSAAGGDLEGAASSCRAAAALEGAARFRAQLVLAELGRRERNDELVAEALEAQAELVERALDDAASGDAEGVPRYLRTPLHAADLLLRAAAARQKQKNTAAARRLLGQAAARHPSLEVTAAQLALSDATGDVESGARVAASLLETVKEGPEAASLGLRVAQAAAAKGDDGTAVAALSAAMKADPASVAARAMLIDALSSRRGEGDGAALASALEAAAEQLGDDGAKARAYVRAAWEWALSARDVAAAKTALSMASSLGLPPAVGARLSRTLAALLGDAAWYDEASRRVLSTGAGDNEQAGLWLELAFQRARRGEAEGAGAAIEALGKAPGGTWLGRLLGAYLRPLLPGEPKAPQAPEALDALTEVEQEPALLRGLGLSAAWRAQRLGKRDDAKARLAQQLRADAGDVVAARYLAGLLKQEGDVAGAAAVLEAAAAASEGEALGASLALEAALLLWRAGQRARALEPLRAAAARAPKVVGPALSWAVRGVAPDDVNERRQALELSQQGEPDPTAALERFGLDLATGETDDARAALEALEAEGQGPVRLAAALARVAWPPVQSDRGQLEGALSLLGADSDAGAALASVERVRLSRDIDESRPDHARQASVWAEIDPSLPAALEWLAASIAAEDSEGEAAAHRLLASQLEGNARSAEEAASTAVQWLTTGGLLPGLLASTAPAAQTLNLELAPAGSDPRRRSAALKGVGGSLGEGASVDALAMAGWSDLAANNTAAATEAFRAVIERRPGDLSAWEGLRTAAMVVADLPTQALATARLGELCRDAARSAAFFEEAGLIVLDQLGDKIQGEQLLTQAFARDARRAVAFDRVFRMVRDRKEDERLVELAQRRLEVADAEAEIVKLYWEQARVFHKRGEFDGALDALSSVTMFEPDHIGALVLHGDIYTKRGDWPEAAKSYAQMASNTSAPVPSRLQAGIQAVNIYEKRLNDIPSALAVLTGLHKAGLLTMPLRERLAALAAAGQVWPEATNMFEALMIERETPEGRIEAARISMAIWRDKVGNPREAKRAVVRLLEESPADAEALSLVLTTDFGASIKAHALGTGKSTLVQQLQRGPIDPDAVDLLARVARGTDDLGLLQAALGVLVTLGRGEGAAEQLNELDGRTAKVPQIMIDAQVLAAIGDPVDSGPITKLFEALGEIIAEALGPTKDALGVGRKERVDARSGLPLRNDIAAWAGALGLGEFELYVGGRDLLAVQGVGGEVPALVVGPGIKSPLSAAARQAIAREVFALKRGTTVVRSRDEATVASIAVAACNLAGVKLDAPPFAILGDVQRQLDKAMNRKVKKLLPELCQNTAAARPDVRAWAKASQRSLDRMAAIAAGDVSLVLADGLNVARNELRRHISGNDRAERLLRFVLSPQYLELRNHLGMGVR